MTSRKKKSRVARNGNAENQAKRAGENGQKGLKFAFASMSVGEASSSYGEADRVPSGAAEIPKKGPVMEDQSTTCSSSSASYDVGSSSSSSSNASDVLGNGFLQDDFKQKGRPKMKVVATAGTVSTMLGKDYVRSLPKKRPLKMNGLLEQSWSNEEAEQFLCSMLGDDSELSLAVVSDVLCQCGYNLDKALDTLLELSASSKEQPNSYYESAGSKDAQYLHKSSNSVVDEISESAYRSSFPDHEDNVWFSGDLFWNNSKIPGSSGTHQSSKKVVSETELPQKVLESLFNMPTPKAAEQEPNKMNWRNIVKQMVSLGQGVEGGESAQQQYAHSHGT